MDFSSPIQDLKSRRLGKKVVFTNGCFDILHPGHIDYLAKAKKMGDLLVVGLNSDESIRRLKGSDRPINVLSDRKIMLESLKSVDLVIPFTTDTPLNLILEIKPDVLVKGGDYTVDGVVGHAEMNAWGGTTEIIPFLDGYSSSIVIERIKSLP